MHIMVIMHVESEGPGSLGTFLESAGARLQVVRLYQGDRLPEDTSELHAVISMGGPMNVYEEDKYPFLREETSFLHRMINADMPVLGICLGAQMIAKAAGARVTRSPKEEVGWGLVRLTDAGRSDVLFQGLPQTLEVLQWHGDMFHIPEHGDTVGGWHGLSAPGVSMPERVWATVSRGSHRRHPRLSGSRILLTSKESWTDTTQVKQALEMNAGKMYTNFVSLLRKIAGIAGATLADRARLRFTAATLPRRGWNTSSIRQTLPFMPRGNCCYGRGAQDVQDREIVRHPYRDLLDRIAEQSRMGMPRWRT